MINYRTMMASCLSLDCKQCLPKEAVSGIALALVTVLAPPHRQHHDIVSTCDHVCNIRWRPCPRALWSVLALKLRLSLAYPW